MLDEDGYKKSNDHVSTEPGQLQRHKVLGRGRPSLSPSSAPLARVLTGQPAGADVNR